MNKVKMNYPTEEEIEKMREDYFKEKEIYLIHDNYVYYTIIEIYANKVAIEKHYRLVDNEKIYDEVLTEHKSIDTVRKALKRLENSLNIDLHSRFYVRVIKEESLPGINERILSNNL